VRQKGEAMTATARSRNPRGEGARLRDEILDAAFAVIDETADASSLSLRGVARRAGISAPSIYSHFADLTELRDAVLSRSFEQLRDSVSSAVSGETSPSAALIAAGRSYVGFAWAHPTRYRLMFSTEGYASNAVETFTLVETLIRECAETGAGSSTNPRMDAWMLWAGLHGVATLDKPGRSEYLRLGPLDRQSMLEKIIQRLACLEKAPSVG
jgi:AcrR family transcriptional regulator